MTPHLMTILHNPPASFGDCYRTCVACVLDVPPDVVPHPGREGVERWDELMGEVNTWLAQRGLYSVLLKESPEWLAKNCGYFGYHLIGGTGSRGVGHWCVGLGGKVIHDPHPDGGGLVADEDGTMTIELLVVGAKHVNSGS